MDTRARFKLWLTNHGLLADPFSTYMAEEEEASLPLIWVDRPHFWPVVGDTSLPRPTFLFASRGEGKTATRKMVEYECKKSLRGEALAVPFFEHSRLLELTGGTLKGITPRVMVGEIIRAILKCLADEAIPVFCYERMDGTQRDILAAYCKEFSTGFNRAKLQKIVGGTPVEVNWNELSPYDLLSTLADILTHLSPFPSKKESLKAIFILFDRMDEIKGGQNSVIDLLTPIICDGPLLETPHISFKFFLPQEVEEQLLEKLPIRDDRAAIKHIEWNRIALEKLVNQRLSNFSEEKVTHFANLCKETAKVSGLEKLLDACANSPRALLQMCSQVLQEHVSTSTDPLIDLKTIRDVAIKYKSQQEIEQSTAGVYTAFAPEKAVLQGVVIQSEESSQEIPKRGLFMDTGGGVWIDGARLTPELTNKEIILLRTLYRASPTVLSVNALIEAVWGSNEGTRTEQNLRKHIVRLREKLEPGNESSASRFIINIKGRGYKLDKI